MRIGIVADLHANLEATQAVFAQLDAQGAERIVCLGDIAGYNASPNEVVDIVRERQIPTLMGNHDAAASGLEEPWFFNSKAQAAIRWQLDVLRDDNCGWLRELPEHIRFGGDCLGVHGSPGNRDEYIIDWLDAMRQMEHLQSDSVQICFFGHSHIPSLFIERGGAIDVTPGSKHVLRPGNRYFINPGSVGQPRDRDPRAAYGLFDTVTREFEYCRVAYDVNLTGQRIVQAGLPESLARRLALGR